MQAAMNKRQRGPVLKSSIKLASGDSTSGANNSSAAGSKWVRFNTDIDVKRFNGSDSPMNISQQNSPINSNVSSPLSSPTDSAAALNTSDIDDYFGYHNNYSDYEDDLSHSEDDNYYNMKQATQYYISNHNISDQTNKNPIYLKSVNYYDHKLVGYLNCLNLNYEKHFQLKLTFNKWKSCILFNSKFSYVKSQGAYDEFKFEINMDITKDFEFVLNYTVNNCMYWDNNNNSNYLVTVSKSSVPKFVNFTYDYNFNNNPYNNGIYDHHNNSTTEYNIMSTSHINISENSDSSYDNSDHSDSSHIDYDSVDGFLSNFIHPDYNSILRNYCFHSEQSHSYFSFHDEIFT